MCGTSTVIEVAVTDVKTKKVCTLELVQVIHPVDGSVVTDELSLGCESYLVCHSTQDLVTCCCCCGY